MKSIVLSMVEGRELIFDFDTYENFITFLQKNRIAGKWRLDLKCT